MVKKMTLTLLFLLLIVAVAKADVEFWSTDTFQFTSYGINVIPEFRIKDNLSNFYYLQTYIGPTWEINKNFRMNVYYGLKYQKSGSDWKQSNLGYLDCINAFYPFTLRSRLEGDATNSILKLREQLQFKVNGYYVVDEAFYNITSAFIDENRLTGGYNWKVNPLSDVTFGYLFRSQRSTLNGAWTGSNAIVINGNVKI
jgi:hypothetical protein